MEPPPSQITVLGWTDVAAIGFLGSPFERALFDVRVFNPYAPSNRQPLIAKARPTMLCISTSYIYIYIYIYIFVSMGSPFGPAWGPRKRATRKRKAG